MFSGSNGINCRQGGWSCGGRKDYKDCVEKKVMHYINPTIDLCDNLYGPDSNGYRGFCSKPHSQCSSHVRFYPYQNFYQVLLSTAGVLKYCAKDKDWSKAPILK